MILPVSCIPPSSQFLLSWIQSIPSVLITCSIFYFFFVFFVFFIFFLFFLSLLVLLLLLLNCLSQVNSMRLWTVVSPFLSSSSLFLPYDRRIMLGIYMNLSNIYGMKERNHGRNGDTLAVILVNYQLLKERGPYKAIIDSQCLSMKYMLNK